MAHVTEGEILDCMRTNFRLAAEHCDDLAVVPARGPTYDLLRDELKLLEGCCRQIAYYRDDARWFQFGMNMEQVHQKAGTWLRKIPRTSASNAAHPLFLKLAEVMRKGERSASDLATKATGRVGMILPVPLRATELRQRPMQVVLPSGLIVPA